MTIKTILLIIIAQLINANEFCDDIIVTAAFNFGKSVYILHHNDKLYRFGKHMKDEGIKPEAIENIFKGYPQIVNGFSFPKNVKCSNQNSDYCENLSKLNNVAVLLEPNGHYRTFHIDEYENLTEIVDDRKLPDGLKANGKINGTIFPLHHNVSSAVYMTSISKLLYFGVDRSDHSLAFLSSSLNQWPNPVFKHDNTKDDIVGMFQMGDFTYGITYDESRMLIKQIVSILDTGAVDIRDSTDGITFFNCNREPSTESDMHTDNGKTKAVTYTKETKSKTEVREEISSPIVWIFVAMISGIVMFAIISSVIYVFCRSKQRRGKSENRKTKE